MMVQLGNGRPRLNVKTHSQVFPFTPLHFLKRKPRRTRVAHWISGPSSQADEVSQPFPAKHRLFTQAAALYKTFWANRWNLWPEKEHSGFPTHQRRPTNGRHIEKQSHLPITTISTQVRQRLKQTAAQKTILGSKYKWLVQWYAECSTPKQPCLKGDQKVEVCPFTEMTHHGISKLGHQKQVWAIHM